MSYPIALGGLSFDTPSLPWRLVRDLQPALVAWVREHDFADRPEKFVALSADDLNALSGFVFSAVACSAQGKAMTREQFDELPITTLEMAGAINPILRACGLRFEATGATADPKA